MRGRQADRSSGGIESSQRSFLAGTAAGIVVLLPALILTNATAIPIRNEYDTTEQ